ncbi:MAG: hypothetical protein AB7J35_10555 [Dehalococcoidia bacterium]
MRGRFFKDRAHHPPGGDIHEGGISHRRRCLGNCRGNYAVVDITHCGAHVVSHPAARSDCLGRRHEAGRNPTGGDPAPGHAGPAADRYHEAIERQPALGDGRRLRSR